MPGRGKNKVACTPCYEWDPLRFATDPGQCCFATMAFIVPNCKVPASVNVGQVFDIQIEYKLCTIETRNPNNDLSYFPGYDGIFWHYINFMHTHIEYWVWKLTEVALLFVEDPPAGTPSDPIPAYGLLPGETIIETRAREDISVGQPLTYKFHGTIEELLGRPITSPTTIKLAYSIYGGVHVLYATDWWPWDWNPPDEWNDLHRPVSLIYQMQVHINQLSGVVTDKNTGNGISGVAVIAGNYQTVTNASGQYTFTDLPLGSYSIRFSKPGYQDLTQQLIITTGLNTLDAQMTLIPPNPIFVGDLCSISKDTVAPTEQLTVKVAFVNTNDSGGIYHLGYICLGHYTQVATGTIGPSGQLPVSSQFNVTANQLAGQQITSSRILAFTFVLYNDADLVNPTDRQTWAIDVIVTTPPPPPGDTASLSGMVTDKNGAPISGVSVTATGASGSTDSSGQYSLTGLTPGTCTVKFSAADYWDVTQSIKLTVGANSLNVTMTPTTETPPAAIPWNLIAAGGLGIAGVILIARKGGKK